MKTSPAKPGELGQNSEGRQARLEKVEGVNLKVDVEQRGRCWGQTGNKPSLSECGNTYRFKAQFSIWLAKKKRLANANPTSKGKGETK